MPAPIPILVYHRIDRTGGPISTAPEVLAEHLAWLAHHGYHTLTARELAAVVSGEAEATPGPAVALTFDDGYADLETEVAPALRRHGFRATSFLITDRCSAEPEPGAEHVSWPSVRALADEGIIEFQTHTHSHTRWNLEPALADEVARDIATSLATLGAELGRPPSQFDQLAWPWGRTCEAWEAAAAEVGARSQYVVQRGAATHAGVTRRLPRMLVDGVPAPALARWMRVLSSSPGAAAVNTVFGTIRQRRQGAGYR